MPFQALARSEPDKPAAIMAASGLTLTYGELENRSCRLAQLLTSRGLQQGDRIAVLMENSLDWFVAIWGARRAGIFVVPVNWHLKAEEGRYIVEDSGARAIITSTRLIDLGREIVSGIDAVGIRLVTGPATDDFESLADAIAAYPATPIPGALDGGLMPYSSGTSGRPKGIENPPSTTLFGEPPAVIPPPIPRYRFGPDTIYLSPAPQYHSAPAGYAMLIHDTCGTLVVMESFDAEGALRAIDRWRVTHAQFVPTHFTRMLALPAEVRARYDHSSLTTVIHAAAPCPTKVKLAMMEWWGPVLYEFYGGSENFGSTTIGPQDWLEHQGSVGRAQAPAILHILDLESGEEVGPGTIGVVYFEGGAGSTYHGAANQAKEAQNPLGWKSYGDLGRLDEDGYLYLADRRSHMILSGGVNIYPQEVENVLAGHPAVVDVAVIGVPNEEFGEEVKAVVIAAEPDRAGDVLAQELIAFCRDSLAHYKCPRTVDFVAELPRYPNGKLHKRELQESYWQSPNVPGRQAASRASA